MFGPRTARTGIDLGTTSVKLVRGEGSTQLERITHIGLEQWAASDEPGRPTPAAAALGRLLARLGLNRRTLGRIAVATEGEDASFREILLPILSEDELRRALPFEAKKHLVIESMSAPLIDCQVLGEGPPTEEGARQTWILLAAVPSIQRDYCLHVLAKNGLEPEVVEIESLAVLSSLKMDSPDPGAGAACAVLDLGGRQAMLIVKGKLGGLLSRPVGPPAPSLGAADGVAGYVDAMTDGIRETLTFYRGRHRSEVESIHVCGGGGLIPGVIQRLGQGLRIPVEGLEPFHGIAQGAVGSEHLASSGPLFATAVGLCRWWDRIA